MESTINFLPKVGHYNSLSNLLELLVKHNEGYTLPYEKSSTPIPEGKFEKIRNNDDSYFLFPLNLHNQHLYRGQNFILEKGMKCQPSLYRKGFTREDLFIESIKLSEFELMLRAHPVVTGVFVPNQFSVDYIGLAQHYGLLTNKLDFTIDMNVAGFFATCKYDAESDCYKPIDSDINTGTFYVYHALINHKFNESFFGGELAVMGLQPFSRPGDQKGYALSFKKDEDLHTQPGVYKYTFDFTKEESEYFFLKFEKGRKLWKNDILVAKTKKISNTRVFSSAAVRMAIKQNGIVGLSLKEHYKLLKDMGINIREKPLFYFTEQEKKLIRSKWKMESGIFWNSIVQRNVISEGRKSETLSVENLFSLEMLKLVGYRNENER